jgi:hypothetical protein
LVNPHRRYGGYGGLCQTRIRYIRLLVHLVGGDLVGDIEEGGDSSGRCFYGVVDLVWSTFAIGLMLESSNGFKGSIESTLALGRWSLSMHECFSIVINNVKPTLVREWWQRRVSGSLWLVIKWFKDFDIILLYLMYFIILVNSQNRFQSFQIKITVDLCTAKKRERNEATVEECGGSYICT